MIENVEVLYHSSIRIQGEKTIYIDPFKIKENYYDADLIFITHDHYDHFSEKDIEKVRKEDTIIVLPKTCEQKAKKLHFISNNINCVKPNETYKIDGISFCTIPAYNINKQFHPKKNKWVGYILDIDGVKYYIAGDTDITDESKQVKCDVAMIPIGGTYTVDAKEAAELANIIQPKIVIPTHYASIVGTKEDEIEFQNNLDKNIQCKILIK